VLEAESVAALDFEKLVFGEGAARAPTTPIQRYRRYRRVADPRSLGEGPEQKRAARFRTGFNQSIVSA
jgi:hypothetical protein